MQVARGLGSCMVSVRLWEMNLFSRSILIWGLGLPSSILALVSFLPETLELECKKKKMPPSQTKSDGAATNARYQGSIQYRVPMEKFVSGNNFGHTAW